MAQPEAHNFRLISHDTLAGFGNVGEAMSLQLASGGRRIMWMAHECAPKNFTGVDVTDPTKPRVIVQTDLPHRNVRSNSLEVCDNIMAVAYQTGAHRATPAGNRAVRYCDTGAAAQHQLHRPVGPALARRAPTLVHRRQDDPLFQRRGRLHAAQPKGRPASLLSM